MDGWIDAMWSDVGDRISDVDSTGKAVAFLSLEFRVRVKGILP